MDSKGPLKPGSGAGCAWVTGKADRSALAIPIRRADQTALRRARIQEVAPARPKPPKSRAIEAGSGTAAVPLSADKKKELVLGGSQVVPPSFD